MISDRCLPLCSLENEQITDSISMKSKLLAEHQGNAVFSSALPNEIQVSPFTIGKEGRITGIRLIRGKNSSKIFLVDN